MAGKRECDRCGKPATKQAEQKKERVGKETRKLYVCDKHAEEHEEAFKKQGFVLTDL